MRELDYFRQLHNHTNANILPVLVEGEPEDAFPEVLFWETSPDASGEEAIRTPIEPLAADARGKGLLKQLWALRTEHLRIAAPILGKSFDELYQRSRRRKRLIAGVVLSAVIGGLAAFSAYNMDMRNQIQNEHNAMLRNESLRLSVSAGQALGNADANLGITLALRALPQDLEAAEKPIIPEAEVALYSSVYSKMVYEQGNLLQGISTIDFPSWGWEFYGLFDEGKKFGVYDQETIYLYDAATGALLFSHPSDFYAEAVFNHDATLIARFYYSHMEQGKEIYKAVVKAVPSGEIVYQELIESPSFDLYPRWDEENNIFYFIDWDDDGNPVVLLAVQADGTVLPQAYSHELYTSGDSHRLWCGGEALRGFDLSEDYNPWSHEWSERGLQYRPYIEAVLKEEYGEISVSKDGELLIARHKKGSLSSVYSIKGLQSGNTEPLEIEGSCYVDPENRRMYVQSELQLRVYAYCPENAVYIQDYENIPTDDILYLSPDGARCLFGASPRDSGLLQIWDCFDFSSPLFELCCESFHVTPDLTWAIAKIQPGVFQIWNVTEHTSRDLPVDESESKQAYLQCINEQASLAAIAFSDRTVEVYSLSDDRQIYRFVLPEEHYDDPQWHEGFEINAIEFEDDLLLISGSNYYIDGGKSWLIDPSGEKSPILIPCGICDDLFTLPFTDRYVTSDGLLMATGEYFSGAVDAIYDIQTGNCVFRKVSYCYYSEDTGILLYLPADPAYGVANAIHAAQRTGDGSFEDIYTISTQNMNLQYFQFMPQIIVDNHFIVLYNRDVCTFYSLTTGEQMMTIYNDPITNTSRSERSIPYLISNAMIYDVHHRCNGQFYTYPLLEMEQVFEKAREYLTSPFGTRELSDYEKAVYFID